MKRPTRQLSLKECYDILNVEKGVSLEDVKHAYRRRAFELHPDLNPNNPEASRQFQLLNEAYVALTAILEKSQSSTAAAQDKASTNRDTGKTSATSTNDSQQSSAQTGAKASEEKRKPGNKAYREEDVLRDLLQDPFARRVFEDIYSELHKQQTARPTSGPKSEGTEKKSSPQSESTQKTRVTRQQKPVHETTKLHQGNLAWDTPNWNNNINKGVTGAVKGWLRRQIDEEQSLVFPKAGLVPGQRIRLQIRQGLQGSLKTVEITLPPDFVPGKAVRLRGLGKRVGPWQGDLYLTLRGE